MTTPLVRRIEAARKQLGVSKKAYCALIGISETALYKIYRGGGVKADTLGRLAKHGGVRLTRQLVESLGRAA